MKTAYFAFRSSDHRHYGLPELLLFILLDRYVQITFLVSQGDPAELIDRQRFVKLSSHTDEHGIKREHA